MTKRHGTMTIVTYRPSPSEPIRYSSVFERIILRALSVQTKVPMKTRPSEQWIRRVRSKRSLSASTRGRGGGVRDNEGEDVVESDEECEPDGEDDVSDMDMAGRRES